MKIIGLAIGNGCTALAGSILSQVSRSANIYSGTGMVVMGLASVIIGTSIFQKARFIKPTTMVILGAILYRSCLVAAMRLGLPTNYLKLLMAIFTIALVSNNIPSEGGRSMISKSPIMIILAGPYRAHGTYKEDVQQGLCKRVYAV